MNIWFLSTIRFNKNGVTYAGYKNGIMLNSRTVGFFPTKEEAIEILENNYGDLNEAGWYPWAVIEEIEDGLYPFDVHIEEKQIFFEWNEKKETWQKIDDYPLKITEWFEDNQYYKQFADIG